MYYDKVFVGFYQKVPAVRQNILLFYNAFHLLYAVFVNHVFFLYILAFYGISQLSHAFCDIKRDRYELAFPCRYRRLYVLNRLDNDLAAVNLYHAPCSSRAYKLLAWLAMLCDKALI